MKLLWVAAVITVVAVIATVYVQTREMPYETWSVPVSITVADNTGVNTETEELRFGRLSPEQSSTRRIQINAPKESLARVHFYGETAEWLSTPSSEYRLHGNTNHSIDVVMTVPSGAEFGDYSGVMEVRLFET
jgi:hypothetical protein